MLNNKKLRILSGIQPSGALHLGNYFGMMSRMIHYQNQHDLFCFIANYHALTTLPKKEELAENTFNAVCDFLALGIDPDKATFWVQSDVPQVTELTWILSSLTNVGLMERATSYKDKISQGINPNVGLFSYPVLMAADILCFDAEIVPVGKDQKQHLEIARDIVLRFNNLFGETLVLPEPEIDLGIQLVPGVDGRKMSKSYRNTIPIFADEKNIRKQVMSILTDNTPIDEPKDKNSPLFQIYSLFLDDNKKNELEQRYDGKGVRYGEIKIELYETMMNYFEPFREKRNFYLRNKEKVREILHSGAGKARQVAENILDRVRSSIGIYY